MSDDLNDLVRQSKDIIERLKMDKATPRISHQDQLREEMATWIGNQTKRLVQDDQFTEIAELELADRIMTHQLSNDELLEYIRIKKQGKAINTTALLEIFKPIPNANNPLITAPPTLEGNENILADLDPSQRQALAKLQMILAQSNIKKPATKLAPEKNNSEGESE